MSKAGHASDIRVARMKNMSKQTSHNAHILVKIK